MIFKEVIKDLRSRAALGFIKYGKHLEPFHNRHKTGDSAALQDLYEELLDAVQYCKQRLVEEDTLFNLGRKIVNAKKSGDLPLLLKTIDELEKILGKL